jgi:hypothetical protein
MERIVEEYRVPGSFSAQHVHVSWRAIFAGIAVALAVEVLLTLLGFAVGLTAFEPTRGAIKGISIGLGLWLILTAIASVFAGAYFGARVAGDPWKGDGVAHGLMVWAGFLLISLWLMGAGAGKWMSTAAGMSANSLGAMGTADTDNAIGMLIDMGYSPSEARQIVEQSMAGQAQTPSTPDPRDNAAGTAKRAANAGAMGSWVAFGVALLSLVGGAFGGMLGAIGEQKQVRRYARRREAENIDLPAQPVP